MRKCFAACLIILTLLGARGNLFSQESVSQTITIRIIPVRSSAVLTGTQYFEEMIRGRNISYNTLSNKVTVSFPQAGAVKLSEEELASERPVARDFNNFSQIGMANLKKGRGTSVPLLFTLLDNN
ncbi:hypothetical protein J7K93_10510 [bacterium]|nr:hypothetical protein [bacterium]